MSALDVSIQAQIINLLKELQEQYKFTYLFISHDLSVVEHISDTVGVMYLGNLVEYGATEDIFKNPLHPYTKALFSAIPVPDPTAKMNRIVLEGRSSVRSSRAITWSATCTTRSNGQEGKTLGGRRRPHHSGHVPGEAPVAVRQSARQRLPAGGAAGGAGGSQEISPLG